MHKDDHRPIETACATTETWRTHAKRSFVPLPGTWGCVGSVVPVGISVVHIPELHLTLEGATRLMSRGNLRGRRIIEVLQNTLTCTNGLQATTMTTHKRAFVL
eukprot:GHUV01053197.1.p3 GENE.GHUV01053197.1~~GHUV01053197.1.p3  ORF type:complete len:103 (-),score=20.10 GHUV01053197.1:108-416(-)